MMYHDRPHVSAIRAGAAVARRVTLGVYQNRSFDAHLQTLRRVIDDGRLGRIWRIHSRMDQDSAQRLVRGPGGGLLRDLGSHVVDQMIYLLGPVEAVDAQLDIVVLSEGATDAGFTITLRHGGSAHSHVSASKLNRIDAHDLRAYGDKGCYLSQTTDVQAQQIFAGKRPADDPSGWGYEPESHWGTLYSAQGAQTVPSEQGRHHDCYAGFARAVAEAQRLRSPQRRARARSPCSSPPGKAPARTARSAWGPKRLSAPRPTWRPAFRQAVP